MNVSVGRTDMGLVRKNNEDAFFIDARAGVCALADGMGGAAAGEIASQIFVETVRELFCTGDEGTGAEHRNALVQQAFVTANQRILDHAERNPSHRGMGCTAELLVYTDEGFLLGHMGDSRTYRLRDGEFRQISKDHSLVQEQIDQGIITEQEARTHRMRNVILRAVGSSETPSLDILRGKVIADDLFLLCSDGLSDMVEDQAIRSMLVSSRDLDHVADRLIEEAKRAGGRDNVTVVLSRTG